MVGSELAVLTSPVRHSVRCLLPVPPFHDHFSIGPARPTSHLTFTGRNPRRVSLPLRSRNAQPERHHVFNQELDSEPRALLVPGSGILRPVPSRRALFRHSRLGGNRRLRHMPEYGAHRATQDTVGTRPDFPGFGDEVRNGFSVFRFPFSVSPALAFVLSREGEPPALPSSVSPRRPALPPSRPAVSPPTRRKKLHRHPSSHTISWGHNTGYARTPV
ncbi:hypothetical protein BH23GEM8_BH23GEM8_08240 [soil metagenome]